MLDIILSMKITFLRDITVDMVKENDTYDRLMREGVSLECIDIVPISKGFSNVLLNEETTLVDLRNDCFTKTV
jgi:hypothetical protein